MRHLTFDMWWEVNILSEFQAYGLGVKVFWRFGGKGLLADLMCNGGVCRTAPATPGLLNIYEENSHFLFQSNWNEGVDRKRSIVLHIYPLFKFCLNSLGLISSLVLSSHCWRQNLPPPKVYWEWKYILPKQVDYIILCCTFYLIVDSFIIFSRSIHVEKKSVWHYLGNFVRQWSTYYHQSLGKELCWAFR